MTCTDCYLHKNCVLRPYMQKKNTVEKDCGYFKDKEKIIELPCKVGQIVYVVSRYYAGDWEVYKCEIDAITLYEKNTFISCVANDVRFGRINFGLNILEIGKTVFLTEAEAEIAARKEQGK